MNVAGATLHSIGEDKVDQLYDWRFIRRLLQIGQANLFRVGLQFDVGLVHVRN